MFQSKIRIFPTFSTKSCCAVQLESSSTFTSDALGPSIVPPWEETSNITRKSRQTGQMSLAETWPVVCRALSTFDAFVRTRPGWQSNVAGTSSDLLLAVAGQHRRFRSTDSTCFGQEQWHAPLQSTVDPGSTLRCTPWPACLSA